MKMFESMAEKCMNCINVIITIVLVGSGLASAVTPSPVRAQSLTTGSNTDFGLSVGVALPQADQLGGVDIADGTNTGFTVAGLVQVKPFNLPLGFRIEGQYTRFGLNDERRVEVGGEAPVIASGAASMLNGTGNAVLAVPTGGRFRPYLIGGLGVYRLSSNISIATPDGRGIANGAPSESETQFGLNGGAGFELPIGSLRTFVEARFHSIFTEDEKAHFVPIAIGVKF